ncbi:MAG: UDP-N-acetylglucosamine 2-epimerase (non-hydrolyzing) [Aggregatilineales bacterium]
MKILHVVGARPNFMKIAPIMSALRRIAPQIEQVLVHTSQHYDVKMSDIFFEHLGLSQPDYHLGVGSGSHTEQTARVMLAFEPVLKETNPDLVLVVGDVNSTIACTLVAVKLGIPVGHVEAGLRSYDRSMPEEINRVLTDQISDLLYIPSPDAIANLKREGINAEKIINVGNVMIDTLVQLLPQAEKHWGKLQAEHALEDYVLVTLHRPANVDDETRLINIMGALIELSKIKPVVFPVHPRTQNNIAAFGIGDFPENLKLIAPVGYLDFLALQQHATLVVTDSGGVQEETTYLGIPCLTVRPNTERPITIEKGTNRLVTDISILLDEAKNALDRPKTSDQIIELWDGRASERIVEHIIEWYRNRS